MGESRFRKYLLYALGEIVLVVIGILIALQINSANSERQDRRMEVAYLNNYLQDLELNQQELQRIINKTARVENYTRQLVAMMIDSIPVGNSATIDSLLGGSNGFTVFMSTEGTIKDIQGSGRLNLISNDRIRRSIATWQGDLKLIREWETLSKNTNTSFNEYLGQRLDNIRYFKGEDVLSETEIEELFGDIYFHNLIYDIGRLSNILNNIYREHLEDIGQLMSLVAAEIEHLKP
jgi:hypothetical protein